ncbi:MAG: hypothetical protein Kow0073_07270 [Immundisolibacter sp.]
MNEDAPLLSVVVPVGPDDEIVPTLRRQLLSLPRRFEVIEVCAADGRPPAVLPARCAAAPDWTVCRAPAGRARQQNHGAALARGQWLWFVHADSRLGTDTAAVAYGQALGAHGVLAYFDLRFEPDGPRLMWLNTLGAWLRSHGLGLPFGDQGLLLRRVDFVDLGGFRTTLSGGEDHDLVWRARRAGLPLRGLPAPIYTSARKYAAGGWARTTLAHLRATVRQARRFARPPDGGAASPGDSADA